MDHRRIDATNDGDQRVILKAESDDCGEIDRRRFVKTAGAILIAAGGVVGCGGTDPIEPTPTGTLFSLVTFLDQTVADRGTITVTPVDPGGSPRVITVPTSGTIEHILTVGVYSVRYAPPAGFTLSAGTTDVQTVTVQADQATTVRFEALRATGTLQVTVSGLDASATNGGSVAVTRPGQGVVTLFLDVSGSNELSLWIGTYDVSYTPPAGHIVASGVTNPQTVSVTMNTTTSVTFQVQLSSGAAPDIASHDF